jgi:inorganic pyrophosphatase
MRIDALPIGYDPPQGINVVVEVPIGGEPVKHEMDKASGTLFVDRMLYTAMRYPVNYGFVPQPLSDGGDPIDVLIASQQPLIPRLRNQWSAKRRAAHAGWARRGREAGCGALEQSHRRLRPGEELPRHAEDPGRQITHFFQRYKDLEDGKWVRIERWGDEQEARCPSAPVPSLLYGPPTLRDIAW